GLFSARLVRSALAPPYAGRELIRQLDEVGSKSALLVAIAGAAIGVVLSLETRTSLLRFGAKSFLPAVVVLSLIRETGPIITALIVAGRVGAGIGAELGSMKVTEQIDAMEASAVDPFKYLVATRVLACMLMLPLLTLVADAVGILAGWLANTLADPISLELFFNHGFKNVTFDDFLPPTFKTAVFGLIIGVVASFEGMRADGGTAGVGRAAMSSVVLSSLLVIVADVVLVRLILVFFPLRRAGGQRERPIRRRAAGPAQVVWRPEGARRHRPRRGAGRNAGRPGAQRIGQERSAQIDHRPAAARLGVDPCPRHRHHGAGAGRVERGEEEGRIPLSGGRAVRLAEHRGKRGLSPAAAHDALSGRAPGPRAASAVAGGDGQGFRQTARPDFRRHEEAG